MAFDRPSTLCQRLACGELEIALVSSFEFLRNPIYRIVDDVSISSDGPVYSVVVAHLHRLSDVDRIELDPASETSVNLLRYLLAQRRLDPELVTTGTGRDSTTARLLIGDQAIRFRQAHPDFQFWDLGAEWRTVAHLPFVYALWLIRPEVQNAAAVAQCLRALRDQNVSSIEKLIANEKHFDPQFCRRYYREHLRFTFGQREKQGLQSFARSCARHALLPNRQLNYDLV